MSTEPTEDMRQHFEPDGSPRRLSQPDSRAHCAVAVGSAPVPPPTVYVEHIAYYPRHPITRHWATARYSSIDELLRVWGDDPDGVVVETVTTHSTFQHYKPNDQAQTRA